MGIGKDYSRVAEVKTASGTFKRSIQRLALLPIYQDSEITIPTEDSNRNINNPTDEPKVKRNQKPTLLLLLPLVRGTPFQTTII